MDGILPAVERPANVPEELVIDFDFFAPEGGDRDVHGAWQRMREAPDIFWTPRNGGHWVATRAEDIEYMQRHHEVFSHQSVTIPRNAIRSLPLEVDPPEHFGYRNIIAPLFSPAAVARLEQEARNIMIEIAERLAPQGECEFIKEVSQHLPIVMFLSLVNLPVTDKDMMLELAEGRVRSPDAETRNRVQRQLFDYLENVVDQRRDAGEADVISKIVNGKIAGRQIDINEVKGLLSVVMFGGLDTVAGMLGFFAQFLATHSEHRRQLVEDPSLIPNAVDELIRRHGVTNTARLIVQDCEYKGIHFTMGDRITLPTVLFNTDERRFENPLEVDFRRKDAGQHASFGNGPHRCAGANLARTELKVFLQEWLKRVPNFEIKPGEVIRTGSGHVNGIFYLPLVWKV